MLARLTSVCFRTAVAAVILFCIALPGAAVAGSLPQCVMPSEIMRLDVPLRRIADRLTLGAGVIIVALGSSSTAGAGASSLAMTYPARLMVELRNLFPARPVTVLNRGISGELAVDMLARFDSSVAAEHPDLVLWQLGTNAVLRGQRLPSSALIRDGIRRMKAIHADVVLIDPQFVKADIEEMIDLISIAAREEKVDLFHRFALMRHWHDVDGIPFEVFLSPDGLHMNDWGYRCFAKALADAIADAATPDRESAEMPR